MGFKGKDEDEFLEPSENTEDEIETTSTTSNFLNKEKLGRAVDIPMSFNKIGVDLAEFKSAIDRTINLGITPSLLARISPATFSTGLDMTRLQSAAIQSLHTGLKTSVPTQLNIDLAQFKSAVNRSLNMGINPSLLAGISPAAFSTGLDMTKFQSAAIQSLQMGVKTSMPTQLNIDLAQFKSAVNRSLNMGINPSLLAAIPSPSLELGLTTSLFADLVNTYQNTLLDSGFKKGEFTLSESLKIVNELTGEIQNEVSHLEEETPAHYSEEQKQFIVECLGSWLEGSMSLKTTLQRIKGSTWALAFVQTIALTAFFHLLHIFLIIDDYQIQQDRKTLEHVETYLEENVLTYKLYKNIYNKEKLNTVNPIKEKLNTVNPIGFTRTDIHLRNGKAKTAPVIPNGFVGQKTLVLMLDRKNNWRKVEVKINGTYLEGWVPESTIIRLKQFDLPD